MALNRGATRPGALSVLLLACAILLGNPAAGRAETRWLSGESCVPALRADPTDPRTSVAWFPADDRVSPALGGVVPLLTGVSESSAAGAWGFFLEGSIGLELRAVGSTFPLETVDGRFGLRAEASRGRLRAVLRLRHLSAHRSDGDSTVAYGENTVSRESAILELGAAFPGLYLYGRAGAAWHAVPEVEGMDGALGFEWSASWSGWRPALGLHWESAAASDHVSSWALFAGGETGNRNPFRIGLRWYHGPGPSAQYPERSVNRWGVEFQCAPLPPGSP